MKTEIYLHQTHHTLADFEEIVTYLKKFPFEEKSIDKACLHIFPELFLTGYPLQDLVLQKAFIQSYQQILQYLESWAKQQKGNWRALVGGIDYELSPQAIPDTIKNVVIEIKPGEGLQVIYTKRLLPNYDIFDEEKYFTPGEKNTFYEFNGKIFGLLICEDMWASSFHHRDPCQDLRSEVLEKKIPLDGIINLSASPFEVLKKSKRIRRAQSLSQQFLCPFIYVNRVGGEDEILFDGESFICTEDKVILELPSFKGACQSFTLEDLPNQTRDKNFDSTISRQSFERNEQNQTPQGNSWENLFNPQLCFNSSPPELISWGQEECQKVLDGLIFGFQEYAQKNGFKKFLVALSGGIDSALVLAIAKISLRNNQKLEAIYMPSIHSSQLSTELCETMCHQIHVPLSYLPIKFIHASIKNLFTQTFKEPFEGLTDENIQSRIRGAFLYTRSNQTQSLVINTSNKSELSVGYSTQYGDSVGALSLLGDLYKTEVFVLSEFINAKYGPMIPEDIINRGPTAELRPDQKDTDSLPPYKRLDAILEGVLSYRLDQNELIRLGFPEDEVQRVFNLYLKSEYKRQQFCPIIKVKPKSFGFGYRVPITKSFHYLLKSPREEI